MRRFKIRKIIAGAALATATIASPLAIQPASAIPAVDSRCTFVAAPAIPSVQISWYPGHPGSQSGLEVACVIRNDTADNSTSASFTIHDADIAVYHNGAAKHVGVAVVPTVGQTQLTLSPANNRILGLPIGNVNRMITGPGIAPRTFITTGALVGPNYVAQLNRAVVDATPAAGFQGTPLTAVLKVENSIARSFTNATGVGGTDDMFSLGGIGSANFDASDIGLSVSGTGITAQGATDGITTIIAVVSPTQVQLSTNIDATGLSPTVSLGSSEQTTTHRRITNTTSNATGQLQATGNRGPVTTDDIGLEVTGSCAVGGLGANSVITGIIGAPPRAIVTPAMTFNSTGCDVVIGQPNGNAPSMGVMADWTFANNALPVNLLANGFGPEFDGDTVASQGVQLNLNPGFIAGSDNCANNNSEGFSLSANWYNPARFEGTGATNTQPPDTKAVGQLYFLNGSAKYSAFVVERNVTTVGDPLNGSAHYDLIFPFLPTGIATCPSTASSPGLSFNIDVEATAVSQSLMPTGTGRPGTGQIRSTKGTADGGYVSKVVVDSQGANPWLPQTSFERLCVYPAGGAGVHEHPNNFQCGAG